MYITAEFRIPKIRNQLRSPSAANWVLNLWCIHIMKCCSVIKNEKRNSVFCGEMAATGENYFVKYTRSKDIIIRLSLISGS